MSSIDKYTPLPAKVLAGLAEAGYEDLRVGDIFLKEDSHYGCDVIRVTKIWGHKSKFNKHTHVEIRVKYQKATNWEATEWKDESEASITEFKSYFLNRDCCVKLGRDKTVVQYWQEAKDLIDGKIDISIYEDRDTDSLNTETAVMNKNSKQGLIAIQEHLEEKKNKAELIKAFVGYEMEKRRRELDLVRKGLNEMVEVMHKKIKKIMRVITTIELYLGIDEEIHQIQEGEKAPQDTPISFRQMVLFMDEEVGSHEHGGICFQTIEMFDEWLLTGNNIDIVLPEKKGMVVLRPRRKDKKYSEDSWLNSIMNIPNHENTYILIRNGECVYRIFTEKLIITDRLFPKKKELQEMYERMQAEHFDSNKEKIEDEMYQYQKRAFFMKGLIDRTEVFHPLPIEDLNIFKLEEAGNYVNFIYDDEATLTDGKMPFKKWKEMINDKITHGSRILITGGWEGGRKDYADRFYIGQKGWDGLKNVPDLPKEGVYEVEKFTSSNSIHLRETEYNNRIKELTEKGVKFKAEGVLNGKVWRSPDEVTGSKKIYVLRKFSEEEELTIMYMPKAEASKGWNRWDTHERKQRTRFKVYPDDIDVLNYDQIEISEIDYYIKSRVDRPNYLWMMPVLKKIRTHLAEEKKNEGFFMQFVIDRNHNVPDIAAKVQEAIDWWKYKNKWKRAITKDDTLALRMIEKRIKSKK